MVSVRVNTTAGVEVSAENIVFEEAADVSMTAAAGRLVVQVGPSNVGGEELTATLSNGGMQFKGKGWGKANINIKY